LIRFQPLFGNAFKEKIFAMKKKVCYEKFLGGCAFQNNIWKNYGKGNAIRMMVLVSTAVATPR
jgi:hypothetical protein